MPSTVTNLSDAGGGSLRQAILDTPAGGTVDFQDGLVGTITLTAGSLAITKDLTIAGPGADLITVSGNYTSDVFDIDASAAVAIAGLTVTGGSNFDGGGVHNLGTLTLTNDAIDGNTGGWGGGIRNDGTLTITDSVISGNIAASQSGGGAANFGTLTIDNSTVSDNSTAYSHGGGIFNSGTLTMSNSSVSNNHADSNTGSGGGIENYFATVTITNSTLTGNSAGVGGGAIDSIFNLTITGSTLSGNSASSSGGGIAASGMLNVTGCTLSNNSAGTATVGFFHGGGGICLFSGAATITDSAFRSNSAGRNGGGGIVNGPDSSSTATMTITGCTFNGNSATSGGGIENVYGTMMLANSTLSGNSAGVGGGIVTFSGSMLTITTSTLSGNSSAGIGGGISDGGTLSITNSTLTGNSARSEGGGIDNGGILTVTNSTLSGNFTSGFGSFGGGIANGGTIETGRSVTLIGDTISGNSADSDGGISNVGAQAVTNLRNTIIARNTASSPSPNVVGALSSQGHNLIGDGTGGSGYDPTDLVGTSDNPIDPRLGLLQDNGGPTQTLALLPGSPAIGAGDGTGVPPTDQRGTGYDRIAQGRIDIGAFEVQAVSTVTTTANAGPGSLRQALLDSNAAPGPNDIAFAIASGGVRTIRPTAALPAITQPLAIDATTQPGYTGTPLIVLTGRATSGGNGLTISAGHSLIRGLVIGGFRGDGILLLSNSNMIVGNYIGTDVTGTRPLGNSYGVDIIGAGNTIGGTAPGAGNLISGNRYDGVYLEDTSSGNQVEGNRIGTDVTGTLPLGNNYGVLVSGSDNTIGRTGASAGNLISGNRRDGVALFGTHNLVEGNFIGTDASGIRGLGNGRNGIFAQDFGNAYDNTIGGQGAGGANTIAFNGRDGVLVDAITGTAILRNSIFANTHLGIKLANGGNHNQAAPLLTGASVTSQQLTVSGRLTSTGGTRFTLEFFSNLADDGEGRQFLGSAPVTTDASGQASFTLTFSVTVPLGQYVTATATDPRNDTSEFSAPVAVTAGGASGVGGLGTWSGGTGGVAPAMLDATAGMPLAALAPVSSRPALEPASVMAAFGAAHHSLGAWAALPLDGYFATAYDEGLQLLVTRPVGVSPLTPNPVSGVEFIGKLNHRLARPGYLT